MGKATGKIRSFSDEVGKIERYYSSFSWRSSWFYLKSNIWRPKWHAFLKWGSATLVFRVLNKWTRPMCTPLWNEKGSAVCDYSWKTRLHKYHKSQDSSIRMTFLLTPGISLTMVNKRSLVPLWLRPAGPEMCHSDVPCQFGWRCRKDPSSSGNHKALHSGKAAPRFWYCGIRGSLRSEAVCYITNWDFEGMLLI